ncbi:uncharacterized protein LOC126199006 [Schistocerca nitens]|uniref:uncharacterized protein LOC126199006 n=1 Tax=Schistocerca nitens TaxID=7011 RepID=UPI002118D639|nr:uncharacterized protein LOC126199006 [Schistocerca nitens]
MALAMRRSWCGCSLKAGSIITAFLFTAGSLWEIMDATWMISVGHPTEFGEDDQQTTAIAMLCLGTIVLATSIALLVASIKERPGPLLVFVVVNAVVGALHAAVLPLEVLALFAEGDPRDAWALLLVAVAGVVLDVYLLVVVYSFHQFLCERQRSGTV